MKIKFTIYWFENEIPYANSNKDNIEAIKLFLDNYGFDPEIKFFFDKNPGITHTYIKSASVSYQNISGYDEAHLRNSDIDFNKADLVLMDYDLSKDKKGDEIIKYIRSVEHDFFTEILFYSTGKNQQQLRAMADRDGLYCEARDQLFEKLKKVISTIIKKSQDLNNLRGLVIAETSDIEAIMKEMILKIISKNGLDCHKVVAECKNCSLPIGFETTSIKTKGGENIFNLNKYKSDISALINKQTSNNLFNSIIAYLNSSLNITGIPSDYIGTYDNYKNRTFRNILAHNPETTSTRTLMKIKKSDGENEDFDEQKFINIRKDIREYKKKFDVINASI